MKSPALSALAACLALFLAATGAHAQFPTSPAADRVLGAVNLTSTGFSTATPAGMSNPTGLAIDPRTGKLYVNSNSQNRIMRFPDVDSLGDTADAEAVFGQPGFSGTASGSTSTTIFGSQGIHVDTRGRLWVADSSNHRVLMFEGAGSLANGAPADRVFGQPNFTTFTSAVTSAKMSNPNAVYVDTDDNLWVADFNNNRVLRFANVSTLPSGAAATTVLGQLNFTTSSGGTSQVKMLGPSSVFVDAGGRLWVSEQANHRVLRFDAAAALVNGAAADAVLGQALFTDNAAGTSAQGLRNPAGVLVDPAGTLYVADYNNNRIVIHKNAAGKANGAAADGVIGQPDFTTASTGVTERKLGGVYLGMALDRSGRLWVSDSDNQRVLRFSPDRSAAPPRTTGKVPRTTSKSPLTLRGIATDTSVVAAVRFRVGKGAFKNAVGTTSWSFKAKLKTGKNTIEIVTVDTLGNTSPARRVIITRKSGDAAN